MFSKDVHIKRYAYIMKFKKLSEELYTKAGHYKFAKKPNEFDRGYMKISDWVNDLCWHYISKQKNSEKEMEKEFKELLSMQRQKVSSLESSLYKEGLVKALNDVNTSKEGTY